MKDNQDMTCSLDYEACYNEYREKYNCLAEKNAVLSEMLREEKERRIKLEAQMEVVRLIFGGSCNG